MFFKTRKLAIYSNNTILLNDFFKLKMYYCLCNSKVPISKDLSAKRETIYNVQSGSM